MDLRVSATAGKIPVILVAPHGPDDKNTDAITEITAKSLKAYSVINRGFFRSNKVDTSNDEADCNRVDHCIQPVVFDEFLKPINKFANQLIANGNMVTIFYIHGCSNIVHQNLSEEVSVIVGYGLGSKTDSLSAESFCVNKFLHTYKKMYKGLYGGKGGGKYAGRDSNNMNQYFRKHSLNHDVQSMQLELPLSMRDSLLNVAQTSNMLRCVIEDYLNAPNEKFFNQIPTIQFI